jgi:hypothetical protein
MHLGKLIKTRMKIYKQSKLMIKMNLRRNFQERDPDSIK